MLILNFVIDLLLMYNFVSNSIKINLVFSGNNLIVFYYLNVSEICTDKRGWSLVGVALLEGRDYCIQNFTNGVVISQTNCICELSIVILHEFQAEVCLSDV